MSLNKDLQILNHLRKNSRKTITNISRDTGIPVTTVFERIRKQEKNLIKKHTSLLDFKKMGYESNCCFAIRVQEAHVKALKEWLLNHPNMNSLYKINFWFNYLVEMVFDETSKEREFVENLENLFNVLDVKVLPIVDIIEKEAFLSKFLKCEKT